MSAASSSLVSAARSASEMSLLMNVVATYGGAGMTPSTNRARWTGSIQRPSTVT